MVAIRVRKCAHRMASVLLSAVASHLKDKSRAQREAGVWGRQLLSTKRFVARGCKPSARQAERSEKRGCGRQPPPAKRFVARYCEPSARQAERSGYLGCGRGSPHLPSASLPAVASRLQDKPSAAEKQVFGSGSPHLRLKNSEGGLYFRNYPRVRERNCALPSASEPRRVCFIALSIHQAERQRATPQAKPPKHASQAGEFFSTAA
jgi:hypothetical protein